MAGVKNYPKTDAMKIYKKYKDTAPEDTINTITNILFRIGILLKTDSFVNDNLHYCRVNIGNLDLNRFNIGTNGKGKTYEYSVASGYAEFMERLQNRHLSHNKNMFLGTSGYLKTLPQSSKYVQTIHERKLLLDFEYDEREQLWPITKVIEYWAHELMLLYNIPTIEELKEFIANTLCVSESLMIPAYDVSQKKDVYIPIDLISYAVGSNGMCAGNSETEAILQGICEIFERYVISEIYYKRITPPTIPLNEFYGTPVYEMIMSLVEDNNYDIIIKDCSLGLKLPAIGVIIIDKKNMRYKFKIGSDFVPHIALERCLTELYQSRVGFIGLPMDFSWDIDNHGNSIPIEKNDINFKKVLIDSSGSWPDSILYKQPSYEFSGFDSLLGLDDGDDLRFSINLIKDLGYNIYVRNNTISEFPTYFIIIPGMSQTTRDKRYYTFRYQNNHLKNLGLMKRLNLLDEIEIKNLIDAIVFTQDNYQNNDIISDCILPNNDDDLSSMNINILLCMLYYRNKEYSESKLYLDKFLSEQSVNYPYYEAISMYISLKYLKKLKKDDTENIINNLYGELITSEIINDMSDPNNIFKDYDLPTCFECERCKIADTCRIFDLLGIEKKLNILSVENRISFKQNLNID